MRYLVILSCLVLAGCTSPLQELSSLHPSADDYKSSVAAEYLAYANSESEQGRKIIAEHYAGKGLKALKGEAVVPEPADNSLSAQNQQNMAAARARLMALMTNDIKRVAPQKLAHTMLLFDCWQHELSKNISQEQAPCAEEFQSTLTELQEINDTFRFNHEENYVLSFKAQTPMLTSGDRETIKSIAGQVQGVSSYLIEIESQGDLDTHSRKLMEKRVTVAHKALLKAGIPHKYIQLKKPEDDRKVVLSCDVAEEAHNTVKITVKTHEADSDETPR